MKKTIFILALCCLAAPPPVFSDSPITGALATGVYATSGVLTSQGTCTVEANSKVVLGATSAIVLAPGFHAKPGSDFTAGIGNLTGLTLTTDADHDGLPDWWEQLRFGNLNQTGSGDFDGDGYSNYLEYLAGSNPANAQTGPGIGSYFSYDALGRMIQNTQLK